MEWQPIETAPKDGASFIGYDEFYGHIGVAKKAAWDQFVFTDEQGDDCRITHWMPLPAAPTAPAPPR